MNFDITEEIENLIKEIPTRKTGNGDPSEFPNGAKLITAAILRLTFAVEKQNEILKGKKE